MGEGRGKGGRFNEGREGSGEACSWAPEASGLGQPAAVPMAQLSQPLAGSCSSGRVGMQVIERLLSSPDLGRQVGRQRKALPVAGWGAQRWAWGGMGRMSQLGGCSLMGSEVRPGWPTVRFQRNRR